MQICRVVILASFAAWAGITTAVSLRPPPTRGSDVADCARFVIERRNAEYPRDHLRRGVQGWVALSFKLTGNGSASDVRVVDSEPRDIFVQAAATAFQQWRFAEGEVQDACLHIVMFQVSS